MGKIKILVVDDHKIVRDGIRAMLLGSLEIQLLGEAATAHIALDFLKSQVPDVVVLDIKLPNISGIDLARMIRQTYPKVRILMLTANIDESYIIASLKAGATGFLSKDCSQEEFIKAVRMVYNRQEYFGADISQTVLKSYVRTVKGNIDDPEKPLSDREMDILKMIVDGFGFKEIGEELNISPRTVESHRKNILEKLGLETTIDLVKYAIKQKIIEI
jgi:DNA-binding NarL/FixJ family response regulator